MVLLLRSQLICFILCCVFHLFVTQKPIETLQRPQYLNYPDYAEEGIPKEVIGQAGGYEYSEYPGYDYVEELLTPEEVPIQRISRTTAKPKPTTTTRPPTTRTRPPTTRPRPPTTKTRPPTKGPLDDLLRAWENLFTPPSTTTIITTTTTTTTTPAGPTAKGPFDDLVKAWNNLFTTTTVIPQSVPTRQRRPLNVKPQGDASPYPVSRRRFVRPLLPSRQAQLVPIRQAVPYYLPSDRAVALVRDIQNQEAVASRLTVTDQPASRTVLPAKPVYLKRHPAYPSRFVRPRQSDRQRQTNERPRYVPTNRQTQPTTTTASTATSTTSTASPVPAHQPIVVYRNRPPPYDPSSAIYRRRYRRPLYRRRLPHAPIYTGGANVKYVPDQLTANRDQDQAELPDPQANGDTVEEGVGGAFPLSVGSGQTAVGAGVGPNYARRIQRIGLQRRRAMWRRRMFARRRWLQRQAAIRRQQIVQSE